MPKIFRDILQACLRRDPHRRDARGRGRAGQLLATWRWSPRRSRCRCRRRSATSSPSSRSRCSDVRRRRLDQFDTELKHIGKVLEINQRATKVITLDDVEIVVPNATLAKASVTNFTKYDAGTSRRSSSRSGPGVRRPGSGARRGRDRHARRVRRARPAAAVGRAQPVHRRQHRILDRFWTAEFGRRDAVDSAASAWYGFARRHSDLRRARPRRSAAEGRRCQRGARPAPAGRSAGERSAASTSCGRWRRRSCASSRRPAGCTSMAAASRWSRRAT